jgi:hypothetical protein
MEIVVFDITRINPNGSEENVYTTIKQDADKFVFDSMFMGEVEFSYKKKVVSTEAFEKELKIRKQAEHQKQMDLL